MIIHKRTLPEQVADGLRKRIADGTYKVGTKIPAESELMKLFGIGRSSIREAVRILVDSGLLRVKQGAGTFVESDTVTNPAIEQRIRQADRRELDEVRSILEIAIAEKAVARRTSTDLERMNRFLSERKAAAEVGELTACIEADIRFHTAVAEATGNAILADLYRSATSHLHAEFHRIYENTDCFLSSQPSHERLVKYLAAGNLHKARATAIEIVEEP